MQSAQAFIRALKNPNQDVNKVDIARAAWDDKSFYAPRKGQAIADWILTRFAKGASVVESLFDCRYWTLLFDVISSSTDSDSWLGPLLNRISIAPIIVTYFKSLPRYDPSQTAPVVSKCIQLLWPLSVQRFTIEHLLECFAVFTAYLTIGDPSKDLAVIGMVVSASFKRALSMSTLRRKIYMSFLDERLVDWLQVITRANNLDLYRTIQATGLECLFNLDVLRDSKSEQLLVDRLKSISPEHTIPALPLLYGTYVQTSRKHRGTLFTGDPAEGFRSAALHLFISFQAILRGIKDREAFWTCNESLLEVVNQENLLGDNRSQIDATFEEMIACALAELHSNLAPPILRCLSVMVRIDYRFIGSHLSDILFQLLLIPAKQVLAIPFLELILDYHVKTRTIHEYVRALLVSTTSRELSSDIHETAMQSIIFHPSHLDLLSKQVRAFLTWTHTLDTARYLTDFISDIWIKYYNSQCSERHEKKRRKLEENDDQALSPEILATHISLSGRITVIVLSSLPIRTIPQQSREELYSLLHKFSSSTLSTALSKTLKSIRKLSSEDNIWCGEIVVVTILQLQYALKLQKGMEPVDNQQPPEKMLELLSTRNDQLLPELRLELLRNLLRQSVTSISFDFDDLLAPVLKFLELGPPGIECVALLHMLTQRWLAVIDARASDVQLEEFVSLLLAQASGISTPEKKAIAIIVSQCFASAEFWELPNIRRVFLASIDKSTSLLTSAQKKDVQDVYVQKRLVSVFEALLIVPVDYFDRNLKAELIGRTSTFDDALASLPSVPEYDKERAFYTVRTLRNRLLIDLGPNEAKGHVEALDHLANVSVSDELMTVTLDLAETGLLKSSRTNRGLEIFIRNYATAFQHAYLHPKAKILNRLVSTLNRDYVAKNIPETVLAEMRRLYMVLRHSLFPILTNASGDLSHDFIVEKRSFLTTWKHVLIFGRWLGMTDSTVPFFGRAMCRVTAVAVHNGILDSPNVLQETSVAVFGVAVEESYWHVGNELVEHTTLLVVTYIIFHRRYRALESAGTIATLKELENGLSSAFKDLDIAAFQHALHLVSTALTEVTLGNLDSMIHLAIVMMRDPPRNTLQLTQDFTTTCINIFNNYEEFSRGSQLVRLDTLRFLAQRCRERPAALRLVDVSGIWLFLTKTLRGCEEHDRETNVELFSNISSIATSLIRLRRDLVLPTLPHMGAVLQLLIMSMRSPRPNLGAKQTGIVSDSLPMWINVRQPLGPEEAKLVARLLESLTTKTVIKVHGYAVENQKAESLAKPFSKHAAYVVKAYIEAVNDSLCVLPLAVKKALQPGLYSLCSMINEYNRDALMVALQDSGDKSVFKDLWKEYEKQKYVGKG
ncbi:hypothetical protein WG66_015522 [Moniliophthora roreri]|nr:hypothetical protein WG66_015522 [Moniliophthora roreri]